ncbi:hypothetical protein [Streptomyces sp. CS014]|uniref:hypothetical protein n=1 Tax=Streptomyces sp. CS014 TaxID=2162707 RepID=UPI000D50D270|nr:hypothetical protein [Streptomyces sp. CS014]PVD04452.1 hypothetical protein DBP12_03235 [Streptomyces sp. CS014]
MHEVYDDAYFKAQWGRIIGDARRREREADTEIARLQLEIEEGRRVQAMVTEANARSAELIERARRGGHVSPEEREEAQRMVNEAYTALHAFQ